MLIRRNKPREKKKKWAFKGKKAWIWRINKKRFDFGEWRSQHEPNRSQPIESQSKQVKISKYLRTFIHTGVLNFDMNFNNELLKAIHDNDDRQTLSVVIIIVAVVAVAAEYVYVEKISFKFYEGQYVCVRVCVSKYTFIQNHVKSVWNRVKAEWIMLFLKMLIENLHERYFRYMKSECGLCVCVRVFFTVHALSPQGRAEENGISSCVRK